MSNYESLSPAAKSVMDAADIQDLRDAIPIADAIRAAADQVVPAVPFDRRYITDERRDARDDIRAELLAIAAELEGDDG